MARLKPRALLCVLVGRDIECSMLADSRVLLWFLRELFSLRTLTKFLTSFLTYLVVGFLYGASILLAGIEAMF